MKLELLVFGITGFIMYNMYYDNKYLKVIMSYKKYYQMALVAFVAISFYLMLKRSPGQTRNLLLCTNSLIKSMPIDKNSMDMISPIFDMSTKNEAFMGALNIGANPDTEQPFLMAQRQYQHQMGSANENRPSRQHKRSVSETKKKYIASMQDWKCEKCDNKLTHTFEIDHRTRLENGGSNDVSNLVALCRECHGQKTAMENM